MPTLECLLSSLPEAQIICGSKDTHITELFCDSRKVLPGSLFICVLPDAYLYQRIHSGKELTTIYISDSIKQGAIAIAAEDEEILLSLPDHIVKILVPNARRALALMAAEFYDHPSRKMVLVGLTGTNGKTTTANLTAQILRHSGFKSVGVIGTLGATTENTSFDTGHTTPGSLAVQRILSEFLKAGVEAVVMEASSHGLALQRVVGCAFDIAIFTNFTQDHLDFHKTMEEYWAAKVLLFTEIAKYSTTFKPFTAIINIDDNYGRKLIDDVLNKASYKHKTYSIVENSVIKAENIKLATCGIEFSVGKYGEGETILFKVPLVGRFNVYNCLAAISVANHLKIPPVQLQEGLNSAKAPAGRMEVISEGQPFTVIVDFAHSPDALREILTALGELATGRIICLFGCGGRQNADRSKPVNMGAVVAELADLIIITSDNPRFEDPQRIMEDIFAGVKIKGKESNTTMEIDRRKAIEYALGIAQEGDTVVFAGKGHETYQWIREKKFPFDDREIAREVLRSQQKA
ncbi:hypothetical protein TWF730_009340 [Orbilia blumenaviensis]|uniref:UDP-N-acetylmuramoyl-L-alanyl-D-glutamate--2,6-diaminopimelate ligase n=1 Tax=Orbilia blumenaviensis TaxID=1796055 RepID=A0AAV9V4K5_9PEZI